MPALCRSGGGAAAARARGRNEARRAYAGPRPRSRSPGRSRALRAVLALPPAAAPTASIGWTGVGRRRWGGILDAICPKRRNGYPVVAEGNVSSVGERAWALPLRPEPMGKRAVGVEHLGGVVSSSGHGNMSPPGPKAIAYGSNGSLCTGGPMPCSPDSKANAPGSEPNACAGGSPDTATAAATAAVRRRDRRRRGGAC